MLNKASHLNTNLVKMLEDELLPNPQFVSKLEYDSEEDFDYLEEKLKLQSLMAGKTGKLEKIKMSPH